MGVVGLFFAPVPLLLKQAYLVWTGIVTAFLFTYIPEWTSWVLLALMALYDLAAVLAPGGPLKVGAPDWAPRLAGAALGSRFRQRFVEFSRASLRPTSGSRVNSLSNAA